MFLANVVEEFITDIEHAHFLIFEHIIDHLVNHFSLTTITDEDIKWMWKVMNEVDSRQELALSCIQTKFKHHLMTLMQLKPTDEMHTDVPNPLHLFDGRVSLLMN